MNMIYRRCTVYRNVGSQCAGSPACFYCVLNNIKCAGGTVYQLGYNPDKNDCLKNGNSTK